MKALYVKWIDAKTWTNDWLEDLEIFKLPVCESRGVIIKEDDEAIFLAQTVSEGDYRNIIGILKASIKAEVEIP